MKRMMLAVATLIVVGCSSSEGYEELAKSVKSHTLYLSDDEFPQPITDMLAENQILLLGEQHYVQEHHEFLASLLPYLHRNGFRQLLLEGDHASSWIAEEYVLGRINQIPDQFAAFWGFLLKKVREYNASIPFDERIAVHTIDMNHDISAFAASLSYADHLIATDGIFNGVRAAIKTDRYPDSLKELARRLDTEKVQLREKWTPEWYYRINELIEVEIASEPIRQWRNRKKDDPARENLMMLLIDRCIAGTPGKTVINCGQTHAQKMRYKDWYPGANYEFIGEQIHEKYRSYHIAFFGTHGEKKQHFYDKKSEKMNLFEDCRKDDLIRILSEESGKKAVVLTLNSPVFGEWARVANGKTRPNTQFDAYIVYPTMTVMQSLIAPKLVSDD